MSGSADLVEETKWLTIDARENAIDSLERAAEFVCRRDLPTHLSKWTAICLHNALYGFLICAVEGSDYHNVLQKPGRLICFQEALRRAQQDKWMKRGGGSPPLRLSEEEKSAIKKLTSTLRNAFEHFVPGTWGIEESGWPDIIRNILRVIKFLALEYFPARTLLDGGQVKRIQNALDSIQRAIPCR